MNLFAESDVAAVVDKGGGNELNLACTHCHSRELLRFLLEEEASAVAAGVLLQPLQHSQTKRVARPVAVAAGDVYDP